MLQNNFEQSENENQETGVLDFATSDKKTFASIEEELEYLRGEVKKNQEKNGDQFEQDQVITQEIKKYHEVTGRDLLHESYKLFSTSLLKHMIRIWKNIGP